MNIGILPFRREKRVDGINRLTYGILDELINIDKNNNYSYVGNGKWLGIDLPENIVMSDSWNIINLNAFMINNNYNIIHSYFYSYYFNSKFSCARILTIHDLMPRMKMYFGENWSKSVHWMDTIIADSEYTKSDIINSYNVSPDIIKVVYPGLFKLDVKDSGEIGVRIRKIVEKPYIMTVSTLRAYKNMLGLVKAFCLFKELNANTDINLIIVGNNNKSNDVIKEIMNFCGERRDIIFTGYVTDDELVYLYKNSIATGFVSFYEGFGLPVLESLSYGKTVICSDQTSIPEVGGDAVEYCNPYDIESIENAIEKVVLNDNYRNELEKRALIQAAKFSYNKAAEETLKIYNYYK